MRARARAPSCKYEEQLCLLRRRWWCIIMLILSRGERETVTYTLFTVQKPGR